MKNIAYTILLSLIISSCSSSQEHIYEEKTEPQYKNVFVIDENFGIESPFNDQTVPEVYTIVATRAVNKMLDQTKNIYEQKDKPKLYIMETKRLNDDLPNGYYLSQMVTKEIIENSKTYTTVNSINNADYYLEALISKIHLRGVDAPIIQYKLILHDKEHNSIGEWVETIRRVMNDDRSWL